MAKAEKSDKSDKSSKPAKTGKKLSKNAIENRNKAFHDARGESVMVMTLGKKKMCFLKDGIYTDKQGNVLDI